MKTNRQQSVFILSLDIEWSNKLPYSFDSTEVQKSQKTGIKQFGTAYVLEPCWKRSQFERNLRQVYQCNIYVATYVVIVPSVNRSTMVYANRLKRYKVNAKVVVISTNTGLTNTMAEFWKWPTDSCSQTGIELKYGDLAKLFSKGIVEITHVLSLCK